MNTLIIGIGSNSRDRDWQMKHGISWLKHILKNFKISTIYNSEAINQRDHDYLNAVISAECKDDLNDISKRMKEYESVCGRTPASKLTGNIPIDIDIVIWNDEVIRPRDFSQAYFQKGYQELKEVDFDN